MKVQSVEFSVRAAQCGPYLGFDFSVWLRANLTRCVPFRSLISSVVGKYYLFNILFCGKMSKKFLPMCELHDFVSTKINFGDFLYKIENFVKSVPKLFNKVQLTRVGFKPTLPKILGPEPSAFELSPMFP